MEDGIDNSLAWCIGSNGYPAEKSAGVAFDCRWLFCDNRSCIFLFQWDKTWSGDVVGDNARRISAFCSACEPKSRMGRRSSADDPWIACGLPDLCSEFCHQFVCNLCGFTAAVDFSQNREKRQTALSSFPLGWMSDSGGIRTWCPLKGEG